MRGKANTQQSKAYLWQIPDQMRVRKTRTRRPQHAEPASAQ